MIASDIVDREVVLYQNGEWLALEGDYWPPMLRLIRAYGLAMEAYIPPVPGQRKHVTEGDSTRLVACLENSYDDIPNIGLWENYHGEPDPFTVPPHEFFSGFGVSYLESLVNFAKGTEFWFWLSPPGTEYRYLGNVFYPIG